MGISMHEGVSRALEANRAAYEAVRAGLRVGMTEKEAYALVAAAVDRVCGGEDHEFIGDFVGGARTGSIEGPPTDYVFREGDLFIIDLSVRRGDVWSDTCRTFFLGEPSTRQREAYEAALAQFMADKSISTRDKEIFRRVALQGESPEDVAAIFDIKRNNVDQIKARMVAKLKELALRYAGICDEQKQ